MQGVDRCDQYRARLSITDGHLMQKWHKKMAFSYIDFARCNAFLTRKLYCSTPNCNVKLHNRDPHREFVEQLCTQLITGEWKNVPDIETRRLLYQTPVPVKISPITLFSPRRSSTAFNVIENLPDRTHPAPIPECLAVDSAQVFVDKAKRRKRVCKICKWEDRTDTISTAYCSKHGVSLCQRIHELSNDTRFEEYWCPDQTLTCWDKFHQHYFPQGLYSASGCIKTKHRLYLMRKKNANAGHLNK